MITNTLGNQRSCFSISLHSSVQDNHSKGDWHFPYTNSYQMSNMFPLHDKCVLFFPTTRKPLSKTIKASKPLFLGILGRMG